MALRFNLDSEASAIRNAAFVFVAARVGAGCKELMNQVGVRTVDLDAIRAGLDGTPGCMTKCLHDLRHLLGGPSPGAQVIGFL
ncbi:hypothetical protein GCM10009107_20000 [Ideonella azotifigens]|uniref:Uncharacterized protein n=1 Tax=Ideonella azotifigens TaxID=513160 RepID=A0ABN1JYR7_9BURK